ncbi:MAG: sel1 repeat family protein [Thermoanaerobaculum sp.]|nr:sel1 repeat family protein [Thermoanaerobaculum sp.]MDW7967310.1 tetratricopeptide repeat protein [Thermoanaerobaculum sp.]
MLLASLLTVLMLGSPWEQARTALMNNDFARAQTLLRPLAEGGDPQAQFLLGHLLELGLGGQANPREAVSWWEKASGQGHVESTFRLGLAYLDGRGVDPDPRRGVELLRQAANLLYHPAEAALGKALLLQALGPGHVPEGLRWLACAAEAGDREAAELVGTALALGTEETVPEPERAIKYLRLAQRLGSAEAERLLAELDPAKDVRVATEYNVHLLWRAAQLGYPDAQFRLAVLGLARVPWGPSPEQARALLETAALNGHPEAAYRWLQLRRSLNQPPSPLEVEALLRQAAEGGFTPAALELGQLLAARQSPESLRWLQLAWQAGHQWAALELAKVFFEGLVVAADPQAALQALRPLAAAQDPELRQRAARLLLRFRSDAEACALAKQLDPQAACGQELNAPLGSTPAP